MTKMDFQTAYGLSGRTALVTGGGSGIGLAIAKCLSSAGARVVIAGRRRELLDLACAEIGPGTTAQELDLADVTGLTAAAEAMVAQTGRIDILVNNAGNTLKKPFEDSDISDFDAVFDVHVRGALDLTRVVMRDQLAAGKGSILFTSSMTAYIGQPNVLGYTVAKTALGGVIRGLSAELAGRGLRVNGVAPGWIDTDLYRKATAGDPARQQKILGRIPMNRLGLPEDIGWACAYLASDAARYVTGQVLLVDGGAATGF
jgi:NAD(P)-dependent dehydrogenase (short-subunit alcohol dehydrogenase family)